MGQGQSMLCGVSEPVVTVPCPRKFGARLLSTVASWHGNMPICCNIRLRREPTA